MKTYEEAIHAMQTGVKMTIEQDRTKLGTEMWHIKDHKHLRVGVNSSMVESAAIVSILVRKGLITKGEFDYQLKALMNEEVGRYEESLSRLFGKDIELE